MNQILNWLPVVIKLLVSTVSVVVVVIIGRLTLRWHWLIKRETLSLQVIPPLMGDRSAEATKQLFIILHGLSAVKSWKDRLLGRPTLIGCEIISTKAQGINYIFTVEAEHADQLEHLIYSYLPAAKINLYAQDNTLPVKTKVVLFKQKKHFAFPLSHHQYLDQHDPLGYITNAMTKLNDNESVRYQLLLEPINSKKASVLRHKVLRHEDVIPHLSSKRSINGAKITSLINSVLFSTLDIVSATYHTSSTGISPEVKAAYDKQNAAKNLKPVRSLSSFEQEQLSGIHDKLSQPLFRASIRVAVISSDKERMKNRVTGISTALSSYATPGYQSIKPISSFLSIKKLRLASFNRHLPAILSRSSSILSAAEVGSLYHWPLIGGKHTDNLQTSLAKSLPAPISLMSSTGFDVVLGENFHHGIVTPIGLTVAERERHVYIIGGTGNGKTTMLQYGIVQDMKKGKGVAVIDPHGDMSETLLEQVPEDRINDVIYFNPDDLDYPIGLNLLELTPGLTGKELLREKDLITESVVSIFRKIFSAEDIGGHRIEYVLRNCIQTALTIPDATLFTIFSLLNDPTYRRSITKKLENKDLVNFWKNEMGKAGEMQKVKMSAGITAKIGRFLFSASAKQILEQPNSTIDFDDILSSGKILICNLSKGLLGEDTSELFGITILAKLQLASLRRARINQDERRPFYLYVDEFQNFATASFVQMLSESRKYKLFITMAEQSTSQQKDQQMISIILANVGSVICFRTANPQDEKLLLPLFSPQIEMGEISNLPSFNFYAKLSATLAQEPLSGHTLLITENGSSTVAKKVIKTSRKNFALPIKDIVTILSADLIPKTKTSLLDFNDALPDEF